MKSLSLITILLTLLIPSYSSEVKTHEHDDLPTSAPYLEFETENLAALFPLLSMDVKAEIVDGIVRAKVTQVYANRGTDPIEASYLFPLSNRAAVHGMKMKIGERVIIADIAEKEKAKVIFEKAKQEKKVVSLLEQYRPNVFQTKVANILPGKRIEIEIEFTELLQPEELVYEWVFPTVVGPRYSSSKEQIKGSEKWVENPYFKTDAGDSLEDFTSFSLEAKVSGSVNFKGFRCKSHKPEIDYKSTNEVVVKIDSSQPGFQADRDFILQYQLAEDKIISGLLAHKGEKENYFLINVQPPKRVKPKHIPGREYIFIVDVSGSMSGFPLDTTKELFSDLANDLRETDKFNILFFAGGSKLLSEESLSATPENIERAIRMMDAQSGGGGTELEKALKRALSLDKNHDISRSFVVITDGFISAESSCFDLIRETRNKANVFCFGIGSSVSRHLVDGIAKVGGGEPFVVTHPNESKEVADRFKEYISSPVLTNIQIQAKGIKISDVQPANVNDLFANRTLMISGKWKGENPGHVIITGKTGNGQTFTQKMPLEPTSNHNNPALEPLWARHTVRELVDFQQVAPDSDLEARITNLGLKYNLITPYTSFVAVDKTPQEFKGNTKKIIQHLPLPSGVSINATAPGKFINGSIPEPSAIYLLLISVISALFVRKRK